MGANITTEQLDALWNKHALYADVQLSYYDAHRKTRELLNSVSLIVDGQFVIIEAVGLEEDLTPALVRHINFVHKGDKVITCLDRILFVPEWCVKDAETIKSQMIETYIKRKTRNKSFVELLKFQLKLLRIEMTTGKTFQTSHLELFDTLIKTDFRAPTKLC
jgi:hypothetical protein